MYNRAQAFEDYRQNNVLTAPPERLLIMLFEALVTNVRRARAAIEAGDDEARRDSLRKARDIVMELINSLDWQVGGEIALNLHRSYTFVNAKLVAADTKRSLQPLDKALEVIEVLEDAWRQAVDNVQRERAATAKAG